MSIHTFSSRDFTRDVSAAKRATVDGPVPSIILACFKARSSMA